MRSRRIPLLMVVAAIAATSAGVAAGSAARPQTRSAPSAAAGRGGGAVATASSSRRFKVSPTSGTPHTAFVVHPAKAVSLTKGESISVQATLEHQAGCRTPVRATDTTSTGVHRHFRLGAPAGGWCVGTYAGTVHELRKPSCQTGQECPDFIALTQLGSFRFTVHRAH